MGLVETISPQEGGIWQVVNRVDRLKTLCHSRGLTGSLSAIHLQQLHLGIRRDEQDVCLNVLQVLVHCLFSNT